MMRNRFILAVGLLAGVVAHGAVENVEPLDWLESRIARLRAGEAPPRAAPVLEELRQRLVARGEDRRVADALSAPPPGTGPGPPEPDEELRALEIVRRRLSGYEIARNRPTLVMPDDARSTLETILRDDAFRLEPDRASTAERIAAWLRRAMLRLFETALDTLASNVLLVRIASYAIVATALVMVVTIVVRRVRRGPRFDERIEAFGEPGPNSGRDPAALLDRAIREAGWGRATQALRAAQEACILALRRLRLLPEDPGMTDLEGLARLGGAPEAVREGFRTVTEAHDRVVYGGRTLGEADLKKVVDAAGSVVRSGAESRR